MTKKRNPYIGSTLDDLLKEEGIYDEVQAQAIKEVTAWQRAKRKIRSAKSTEGDAR